MTEEFSCPDQQLLLQSLWQTLCLVRPGYTLDDVQRARPYLFLRYRDAQQADGSIDPTLLTQAELMRLFSIVPDEFGMSPARVQRMNQVIDRTIAIGLMLDDYTWAPTTTKTQIAMWVEILAEEMGIRYKWKWAKERWELIEMRQCRSNTINIYGRVNREDLVVLCFK